jgi:hypothetical protein
VIIKLTWERESQPSISLAVISNPHFIWKGQLALWKASQKL